MKYFFRLFIAATALMAMSAHAQVSVEDAWVRATVAHQKTSGAFMKLRAAQDRKLVAASSPLAPTVEIHEMRMQRDVMTMQRVAAIDLPAGKTVALEPGGYHIMFMDLGRPLQEGEKIPLSLVFEGKDGQRETVDIQAPVRAINHGAAPAMHKH